MSITIEGLQINYDKQDIIRDVNLHVYQGELLALIGESGSGKTSIIKAIAGLIPVDKGKILIHQQSVAHLPPQARKVAIVFQDLRLFPHLTVGENIAFPLKNQKKSMNFIQERVKTLLREVQLPELADRRISSLSGGQKQRIAIARALASEPDVLLLDEPFSGLDESLREEMGDFISALQRKKQVTTLLVTHDKREAMRYAERVALLYRGKIHQISPPQHMLNAPRDHYTAQFLGTYNTISGRYIQGQFVCNLFSMPISDIEIIQNVTNGSELDAIIRPKNLTLLNHAISDDQTICLGGVIDEIVMKVDYLEVLVSLKNGLKIWVNMNQRNLEMMDVQDGSQVYIIWQKEDMWFVESQ